MKPATLLLLLAAAAVLVLGACSTDPTPSAEIESATPEQLTASDDALDDLTIALHYDDGDGDLGGGLADIHDCRADGVMIELAIPAIAAERNHHISGTLDLHVNDIGDVATTALPAACEKLGVKPLAPGTAVFCVILTDAAGHHGAGDCTGPIDIMP
jgi:hypothetical protein